MRLVGEAVEISRGGDLIRTHAARHDRAKEHGAFAIPGGRPRKHMAREWSRLPALWSGFNSPCACAAWMWLTFGVLMWAILSARRGWQVRRLPALLGLSCRCR